jgi:hypothetical protein
MIKTAIACFINIIALVYINAQETSLLKDSAEVKSSPLNLIIQHTKSAPIKIDGLLDDAGWQNHTAAKDFVEIEPGDNCKPPVETEAWVTYDDDNLYIALICYDKDMNKLVSNMCDRDKIFNDDFAGFVLDTYNDSKQAVEFYVNPYGIQGDLSMDGNNEDTSPDYIWFSDAKIYKDRWVAEFAIPFKSLRFPDRDDLKFGLHFIRTWPRESRFQFSWAPISRDNPSFLGQEGFLSGIKKVKRGKNLEILPYVLGSMTGYLKDPNDGNSKFISDSLYKGEAGINVKYGFTSNLTGELTYNPDFSQVESDATQIDVNSSSALFYSEKRPFFLEGSSIFSSYFNTVYTRMLNHPLFAAKLTGKIDKYDIGYIAAYDQNTPFIVPYDYGSYFLNTDLKSFSNIFRIKRDLKGESYIGFFATDREVNDSYNRVLSFDGTLNFLDNHYFKWQLLGYNNKELNDTNLFSSSRTFGNNHTLTFDGEKFSGFGGYVSLQRRSRHWNYEFSILQTPPEARRDVGYIGAVNSREFFSWQSYVIKPENSFILHFEPQINGNIAFKFDGTLKERTLVPNFYIQFKKMINMSGGFLAVNDEEYKGVFHTGVHRGWIDININTSKIITGGMYYELGKYIVRFEDPSYVGWGYDAQAWLILKPMNRLQIESNYYYSELSKSAGGEKLYAGYVFRNKLTYQLTKNLFFRIVGEYDSFNKSLNIDPLFSYKWNPFTIFYIGSSHYLNEFTEQGVDKRKLKESSRQIFAKFQYLFRI